MTYLCRNCLDVEDRQVAFHPGLGKICRGCGEPVVAVEEGGARDAVEVVEVRVEQKVEPLYGDNRYFNGGVEVVESVEVDFNSLQRLQRLLQRYNSGHRDNNTTEYDGYSTTSIGCGDVSFQDEVRQ